MVSLHQIRSIVNLAVRAPSGDNTQPWRFEWDGETLTVLFRPLLARHILDAGHTASGLALGCLLKAMEIAAGTEGFTIQTTLKGFPQEEGACAEIRLFPGERWSEVWREALMKRATDRRPFRRGRLPVDLFQEAVLVDPRDGIKVYAQGSVSNELLDYIAAAETLVTVHPRIFPDTLPWIRMSRRETERRLDGMPWPGTGIRLWEYPAVWLMRLVPKSFPFFSRAGMRHGYPSRVKRLIRSSAGLVCFTTAQPGPEAPIHVGQRAMHLWLRLTQLGYGVQPLAISSLSVYNARIGVLDAESEALFKKQAPGGETILRRAFGIPESETPVWLFRTGLSTALPPSWITPRRDSLDLAKTRS